MARIKVDHQKMVNIAKRIDNDVSCYEKKMQQMDNAMVSLESEWQGVDYQQVKKEWDEINASGSTADKTRQSLKSYANSIREAAELYMQAQARAINRADTLCK